MRHSDPALDYIRRLFAPESPRTTRARERLAHHAPQIAGISVGAEEGRLLQWLIRAHHVKRVVEIGSLTGYSGFWMAEALPPEGELHLIERDPAHAALIREELALLPPPPSPLPQGEGERSYTPQALHYAQTLRKQLTDAERQLWHALNRKQTGFRFRRQHPVGQYIVDFVCLKHRLIIEVDGSQHAHSTHDKTRDAFLKAAGYHVLRFWNNEVLQNLEGVLQRILETLAAPSSLEGGRGWGEQHTPSYCPA